MRQFIMMAIVAIMSTFGVLPSSLAEAGHRNYRGTDRAVVHYGTYPRYRHVFVRDRYGYGDPYAYRYEPRGYYPYYNSGYWKPAHVLRARGRRHYVHPPYYAAWGYPDRYYRHRAWHAYHHGRIRHGHW